jgi:tRNA(His) 5'-end guanylyltransferase
VEQKQIEIDTYFLGKKGHINNLFNTTFWTLVKSGMTEAEAEKHLRVNMSLFKVVIFKYLNAFAIGIVLER